MNETGQSAGGQAAGEGTTEAFDANLLIYTWAAEINQLAINY